MAPPGSDRRRRELLRFLKGTPQQNASLETAARRIGAPPAEIESLAHQIEDEGAIRRDGERLIVVEPGVADAPPERDIP